MQKQLEGFRAVRLRLVNGGDLFNCGVRFPKLRQVAVLEQTTFLLRFSDWKETFLAAPSPPSRFGFGVDL